jgi:hypothetical protein
LDPKHDVDIEAEQEDWEKSLRQLSSEHFELHYPAGSYAESQRESIVRLLEERLALVTKQIGPAAEFRIRFFLYPSHQSKGRLVDSVSPSHVVAGSRAVHALYTEASKGLDGAEEVGLLLDEAWGVPAEPYLRSGLARVLAGLPFEDSAVRYVYQGFPAEVRRLSATDHDRSLAFPDPIYRALAASWTAFLRDALGTEAFRKHYTGAAPVSTSGLERRWRRRLEADVLRRGRELEAEAQRSRASYARADFFHKGFNYAYTNSRESGYPTDRSRESIEALRDVGANAVALVPYGFSPPDRQTEIRRAGNSISTESDESIRVAAADARTLGLKVMLKPQLWISYRDWPSGIDFERDEDWAAWFESYESWILSYALLAEELQLDLFCLGTELTHPALEQPERFRALISRIRRVYRGPLTYAANWYREFEEITFWDDLDLIGLDNYFPLTESPDAGEGELRRAAVEVAARVEKVARRTGKPVIFTEVGFPSVRTAGTDTDHNRNRGEPDVERQALLYRITFDTYWSRPWFQGLYWWKWFSNPANAGPAGDIWTPRGKPAEKVVVDWFGRPAPGQRLTKSP